MPETFEINSVDSGDLAVVLRIHGQMNARSTPRLLERCRAHQNERKHVVLNLSGVTFIASSGVGALLALVEDFRESGLRLRLAEMSPVVESVIRLLNLHNFLGIDETEAAALAAVTA
jgi:anti-sigma B factor antagonist